MARTRNLLIRTLGGALAPGGRRGRLSTLIYHRVIAHDDALNTWDVTADEFDSQMRLIAESFNALPLSEAIERLARGDLPPRSVCITFDDGYRDNAEVALPILQKHKVPATFFVATGYLDGGRMWNDTVVDAVRTMPGPALDLRAWGLPDFALDSLLSRRKAIQSILGAWKYLPNGERETRAQQLAANAGLPETGGPMMNAPHVRALRAAGMEIGAHSVTHPILALASPAEARREIVDSGERLGEIIGERVRLFAYPNGKPGQDYGPEHVRMVRDAGYSAAMSTAWGVAAAGSDVYQLPRFTPWDRTPARFALRLLRNARNVR